MIWPFARRDGARARIIRVGGKRIHEFVVVRRIMVKQAKLLGAGFIRQANAACPCGMAPALTRNNFTFCECGIIDDQVGIAGERHQFAVAFAGKS